MNKFTLGQLVWTGVWVCNAWQRMCKGVIVGVHSGYCDVDVMSLHGGNPWIRMVRDSDIEPIDL